MEFADLSIRFESLIGDHSAKRITADKTDSKWAWQIAKTVMKARISMSTISVDDLDRALHVLSRKLSAARSFYQKIEGTK